MNVKTIIILLAGLLGFILTLGGTYVLIDNLIQPKGYLFEGIVLLSLGFVLDLMVIIASSIGQTMLLFADIIQKQTDLHNEVINQANSQKSSGMSSFLDGLMKNGGKGSVIIKDLDNPDSEPKEMPIDGISDIGDIISKMMKGNKKLRDMNIDELEKELSKAVKNDDFEKAEEIKKEIQSRQNNSEE